MLAQVKGRYYVVVEAGGVKMSECMGSRKPSPSDVDAVERLLRRGVVLGLRERAARLIALAESIEETGV